MSKANINLISSFSQGFRFVCSVRESNQLGCKVGDNREEIWSRDTRENLQKHGWNWEGSQWPRTQNAPIQNHRLDFDQIMFPLKQFK